MDRRAVLAEPPDPGSARGLDDLIVALRLLKAWAGDPSYEVVAKRINRAWQLAGRPQRTSKSTVADCFLVARPRPDEDLVLAVVNALRPDAGYLAEWRQALRIIRGEAAMASFVQARDKLPEPVSEFVGRSTELAEIGRHAAAAVAQGRPSVLVIEGMAGVGKTELAIAAARVLVDRHGLDRVLAVNLRGFDPGPTRPAPDPAAVLDVFLRLSGVPGHDVPHGEGALDARANLLRERLDRSPALLLLDNAANADQVRPLLPNHARCPALVTSRNDLGVMPEAVRIALDVFNADDAVALLRAAAGPDRYDAEPEIAALIARVLGRLPLALGLTASRIRADRDWSLTDHLNRLVESVDLELAVSQSIDDRLKIARRLRLDDPVKAALGASYDRLGAQPRRVLLLLAHHPGGDLDSRAAAALADVDLDGTRRLLRELLAGHLLQQKEPDRYELHDVVRAYATGRTHDELSASARRVALTRLLDHYLYTASLAMDQYSPFESDFRPRVPSRGTPAPVLTGRTAATEWLDRERPNLVAAATYAAGHGWPDHSGRLAATLAQYLDTGAHHEDAEVLHTQAANCSDSTERARALTDLGLTDSRRGRYASAVSHFEKARPLFVVARDHVGEARVLKGLGDASVHQGRYQEALERYTASRRLFRKGGHLGGENVATMNLAFVHWQLGRHAAALQCCQEALANDRAAGDRIRECGTLGNLGLLYTRLGRYQEALDCLRRGLVIARDLGDRHSEAAILDNLGELHERLGLYVEALEHYRGALALVREHDDRQGEVAVLNGTARCMRCLGSVEYAIARHREALTGAGEIGDRFQQAEAHDGIAHCHVAVGEPGIARAHWDLALELFTELGTPEAAEVAARLTALDG